MRTIIYVDGFNLYYRMLKAHPQYKWVNPIVLAQSVLRPQNSIVKLRYFTARVSGRLDPTAPRRQKIYLDALATVPEIDIHFGHFLEKKTWMGLVPPESNPARPHAKPPFQPWPDVVRVYRTEEKGSDVNLASHLLLDAFQNNFDVAGVISNDSDLVEPIRITTQVLGKPVGLLSPVPSPNPELKAVSSFLRRLSVSDLAGAQFNNPILKADGTSLAKPSQWV